MYKVTTFRLLNARGVKVIRLTDLSDSAGRKLLDRGAIFDRSTADLAEAVSVSALEPVIVEEHEFLPGDEILVPTARGWFLGRVAE